MKLEVQCGLGPGTRGDVMVVVLGKGLIVEVVVVGFIDLGMKTVMGGSYRCEEGLWKEMGGATHRLLGLTNEQAHHMYLCARHGEYAMAAE